MDAGQLTFCVRTQHLRDVLYGSFGSPAKAVYQCQLDRPRMQWRDQRGLRRRLTQLALWGSGLQSFWTVDDGTLFGNQAGASFMYEHAVHLAQRNRQVCTQQRTPLEITAHDTHVILRKTFELRDEKNPSNLQAIVKAVTRVDPQWTRITLQRVPPPRGAAGQ
jgi:hypothetical protein